MKEIQMENNSIKILGIGCTSCVTLEKLCKEVVAETSINSSVEKVNDYKTIMSYKILSTPGLVINEKVVLTGKVPAKEDLLKLINDSINLPQ